ncbi:MAG: nuclear transport factor 2 family protein [Burkholderiales bacterium]
MTVARERKEEAIVQAFRNYVQAFQTLDLHTTLTYFHLPCMFISPQGVHVLLTAADVETLLTQVMQGLKARGYARSELLDLHVNQMGSNTALVTVSRVRYAADGQELERFGETYTLRRIEDGWKIVVAMIHDPDVVLR